MTRQVTAAPKPYVFVLMPFAPSFDDIYNLGIKEAAEKIGTTVTRVDKQFVSGPIPEHIFKEISRADVIVAEMTGRNPNVYYEAGYADALGKTILFLTQKADEIPFDLKHRQFLVYGQSITKLRDELAERLQSAIRESSQRKAYLKIDTNPLLGINGRISEVPYSRYETVDDLLDDIWYNLSPYEIPSYTYRERWLVIDSDSETVFRDIGTKWAERHGAERDTRRLETIGILPGMTLEIIQGEDGPTKKKKK